MSLKVVNEMNKMTKLDMYDTTALPGVIRVSVESNSDPTMLDILSELQNTGGHIYFNGYYYEYLNEFEIIIDNGEMFLELSVVVVEPKIRGVVNYD